MKTIEVFDPAMCCTTGVCGPSVDPTLARFAGDVEWLSAHGAVVERFNLAQQPGVFAEREIVRETLRTKGESCLPLILADGKIVREGTYPGRAELAALAEVDAPAFSYTPMVDLVAVAAAVRPTASLAWNIMLALPASSGSPTSRSRRRYRRPAR